MSLLEQKKSGEESGKKFRLIVRSAEEAVRVIREKLGDNAKVISVRQVGGEGLKRFISSPKLEVIAQVLEDSDGKEDFTPEFSEEKDSRNHPTTTTTTTTGEAVKKSQNTKSDDHKLSEVNYSKTIESSPESIEEHNNSELLCKFGFDQSLLSDIQSWSNWEDLRNAPLGDMLKNITIGLSDRFKGVETMEITDKIALIGAPGVGKTTTLCKFLAHEVFMNKTIPNVLKVENGVPNPDDALRIFCEVVGVTLYREEESLPKINSENPLFLDFPGLCISEIDEWRNCNEVLDRLDVKTRILVVNGAYDRDIINKSIRSARHLNATHIAITHYDEMTNSTKLWPIILNSMLVPVCICDGQNVTGDFSTSVLNQLISKTFPKELYSKGFTSYQRF